MSGKKTIVTLLRVSLLACPLLFTTPSFAMIDTPSVKVGFSPEGSASALVLDWICPYISRHLLSLNPL
ncbi:hypothetical protein ABJ747_002648, partial [Escherichia coli]